MWEALNEMVHRTPGCLIFEGPDNAGKTTTARAVARLLGVEVSHSGGPRSREAMTQWMEKCLIDKPKVLDRWSCVSEPIYGLTLRGDSRLTQEDLAVYITTFKYVLNPVIIYCRPSIGVLLKVKQGHEVKDHETVEHVEGVKKNAEKIVSTYDEVMGAFSNLWGITVVQYAWDDLTEPAQMHSITHMANLLGFHREKGVEVIERVRAARAKIAEAE